jgi:hypothetical protein
VHVDFPLLQLHCSTNHHRLGALSRHQDPRDPRHQADGGPLAQRGTHVGGWTAKQIHEAVLTTFGLSERRYRLNQLRYDLRKLKGHGLLERDGSRYAYRLTTKGVEVALLFLFFHKRLCGPLANRRFDHPPDAQHRPDSRLEAAYHRADAAIQKIVDLLAAA